MTTKEDNQIIVTRLRPMSEAPRYKNIKAFICLLLILSAVYFVGGFGTNKAIGSDDPCEAKQITMIANYLRHGTEDGSLFRPDGSVTFNYARHAVGRHLIVEGEECQYQIQEAWKL